MQFDRHLFLIGFMGSGKSYWGRRLADAWQMPFVDLDERIVAEQGKSIPEIFQEQGEAAFREMERAALHALAQFPPAIVATGGGTPCFFDNMDWMNSRGLTIYLKASPALLAARLLPEKKRRPLLANIPDSALEAFIAQKLEERMPFYNLAQKVVDVATQDFMLVPGDEASRLLR